MKTSKRIVDGFLIALVTWLPVFGCSAGRIMPSVEPISHPELRVELLQMVDVDQTARKTVPRDVEAIRAADRKNASRLREIIQQVGWPNVKLVGTDGQVAAWLLAQHADHDRELQFRILQLMENEIESGRGSKDLYAYLYDRVHTPQRFGTQGSCGADGQWTPRAIENPGEVNARRAKMNMPSIEEYAAMVSKDACARDTVAPPK